MTAMTRGEFGFPRAAVPVGNQDHEDSDGLFVVTLWSVVGLVLTALTIWLGLGGQVERLVGLG